MSQTTPIVDMRSRPAFLHPFFGAAPGTPSYDVVRWLNRRVGGLDVDHFARAKDAAGFLTEMDRAEITVAIMVARSVPGVRVSNEDLSAVAAASKTRLIGVASVDPIELGREAAVAEARHAVQKLGMKGVNLDAGFYATPMKADDERLMPLYELCQELNVPAFVMSGPTTPNLAFNDPLAVDHVAKTFPKLPIICCHGFYPYVNEMVTVAFRNENVYVSPDMYTFSPGGGMYVEAANGFMRDQFLFGSSYPFRPMKQGVQDFRQLGLSPEAYEAATFRTANRLLDLGLETASADIPKKAALRG
ncbi:amidohydrolase family protein [Methylocella silvestris]|uniref:Amidohydrolase n=1 Tax=Methylocella silvestris TaxID=199596 RepID=A0A2J7TDV6_METSI|nr:amidohydrolase [Methylocella silvestris]